MADDNVTVGEDGVTPAEGPLPDWTPDPPRLQISQNEDGTWSWRRYNEDGLLVESSGKKPAKSLRAAKRKLRKGETLEGVGDDG